MNKSQKVAVFAMVMAILLLTFIISVAVAGSNTIPIIRKLPLYYFVFIWVVFGISIILLRKKQNSSEVESDERDVIIKQKAIFSSYITLWILTVVGSVIPAMLYERGMITDSAMLVYMIPVAVFIILIFVMLVYSLAVLVQYGWKEKNNE